MGELNNILQKEKLFKQTTITESDKKIFKELETFLSAFNDFQKKAIISDAKKICCVAGAGSGKTTVLTKRIEFLVRYRGIPPEKILAITFTRKAKQEMQNRLLKSGISVHIETFNSFCEKILLKFPYLIYGKPVKLINYSNKSVILGLVLQSLNLKITEVIGLYFTEYQRKNKTSEELTALLVSDCFFIVDYFKTSNKEVFDFSQNAPAEDKKVTQMIYLICKNLQKYMKLYGFRSYNDQLLDASEFFKKNTNHIPRFDHILVDEYQDVNPSQIDLLKMLNPNNLFVVGDPRQSIFGWRGSDMNEIITFAEKNPDAEIIILSKNYRSCDSIVEFMNEALRHAAYPDLESIIPIKNKLYLHNFRSENEETKFIVEKIQELNPKKFKIFVLARTNKQLNSFPTLFKHLNIPYLIKKEDDVYHDNPGEVVLSTIHAIKGLESDIVFVIGCNEQHFPCKYSDHPILDILNIHSYDKIEEERRLFYVAISRARHHLYLTYTGKKPTYFINDDMKKLLTIPKQEKLEEDLFEPNQESEIEEEKPKYKEDWEDMIGDD